MWWLTSASLSASSCCIIHFYPGQCSHCKLYMESCDEIPKSHTKAHVNLTLFPAIGSCCAFACKAEKHAPVRPLPSARGFVFSDLGTSPPLIPQEQPLLAACPWQSPAPLLLRMQENPASPGTSLQHLHICWEMPQADSSTLTATRPIRDKVASQLLPDAAPLYAFILHSPFIISHLD